MNARQIIFQLERNGWVRKTQKGSHAQFEHPIKKGKVTGPIHGKKDFPPKMLHSILKQAGLK